MSEKKPSWMKANDDGSMTVPLSRPIEINGAKISALTMREPTVGDQVVSSEMSGSEVMKEITLFANLCTISPADMRRLPVRDYMRLQVAFGDFID